MGDELLAIRFELKQLKGNKILVFKELKNKPYSLWDMRSMTWSVCTQFELSSTQFSDKRIRITPSSMIDKVYIGINQTYYTWDQGSLIIRIMPLNILFVVWSIVKDESET